MGRWTSGRWLRSRRASELVAAWAAVFVPLGALAALLGITLVQIVVGVTAVVAAVCVAYLKSEEIEREEHAGVAALIRTPNIHRVRDLAPLQAGVEKECVDQWAYIPRDVDVQVRTELRNARSSPGVALVALSGPSKAGKSRTMFEAAQKELPEAWALIPTNASAVGKLLAAGLDERLPPGPMVIWLDDLEDYVGLDREGLHPGVLDSLTQWRHKVIVVATYGGKGTRRLGDRAEALADPMRAVFDHPAAKRIRIFPQLSDSEAAAAITAGYSRSVVDSLVRGVGEFMIAADRLAERFMSGSELCPEGVAVASAAVDWRRAGVLSPIPKPALATLFRSYLTRNGTVDFERGLEWALKPLYASVALLQEASTPVFSAARNGAEVGYQPYDYLVRFVDSIAGRERLSAEYLHQVVGFIGPHDAYYVGLEAYRRGNYETAQEAWEQAQRSDAEAVSAAATFNLGFLAQERGDTQRAFRLWLDADRLGSAEAAFNLGLLYLQEHEMSDALEAWQRADARGARSAGQLLGLVKQAIAGRDIDPGMVSAIVEETPTHQLLTLVNLGLVLEELGAGDAAEEVWTRASATDHGWIAGPAALNLARHLRDEGDREAEATLAYERALAIGDGDVAREAQNEMAELERADDTA